MSDLVAGLGVALVLEGLLWALAPDLARRIVAQIAGLANSRIQMAAVVAVAFGVLLVWLVRG
ncbi:MAG TPA: DUF2065 domain-containing protein [Hyphomicrobium sp.]|jgi:uncharacterized protein YjeT (DUF2065 family)|uniref:DUF2065 domain-containing protein n=1 Tax=Hyphomicrobium sp. TaxID=82 RepID=UPI002BE0C716|nr:DUF2065 domain-containing protein [Hyphomicrobium sp.]HXE00768.1 DUF2065 domain-containing protein [Hyphomicrobium sp.]